MTDNKAPSAEERILHEGKKIIGMRWDGSPEMYLEIFTNYSMGRPKWFKPKSSPLIEFIEAQKKELTNELKKLTCELGKETAIIIEDALKIQKKELEQNAKKKLEEERIIWITSIDILKEKHKKEMEKLKNDYELLLDGKACGCDV